MNVGLNKHYDGASIYDVPLHVYLNTYITVVIVDLSITILLHNTPLYSTYKGIGSP
jgi:hypothetical protein